MEQATATCHVKLFSGKFRHFKKNADKEFEHGIFHVLWAPSVTLLTYSLTWGKDWKLRSLQFGAEHCWLHRSHGTLWVKILSWCWALIFAMVRLCILLALWVRFLINLFSSVLRLAKAVVEGTLGFCCMQSQLERSDSLVCQTGVCSSC